MEKNIFENAYFGKAYKTKDGRKAVFYCHHNGFVRERANYVTMILEGQESIYRWYYDGTASDHQEYLDIVSEWQEETDDIELYKLVLMENPNSAHGDTYEVGLFYGFNDGFEAGYRKAMENFNK